MLHRAAAPVLTLVLLAGCTDPPAPPPPSPTPVAPVALASRTFTAAGTGDRITVAMTPLVRTQNLVVLTVPARLDRAGRDGTTGTVTTALHGDRSSSFDGARLIDEAGGRVWEVARGGGTARRCLCTGRVTAALGETVALQAAYAGIPADVQRLTVMLPAAGVFPDVPVTAGTPPAGVTRTADGDRVEPADLTAVGDSVQRDLVAYVDRTDVPLVTSETPKQVDLTLSADVLFEVDESALTPAAASSIGAAVADLRKAGAGPLTVTGHTDDQGGDAHNQALSEARARTVAGALTAELPDAQWPKTVSGEGEKEPIASNATPQGRQANRRVTVSYQRRAAAPSAPAPGDGPLTTNPGVVVGATGKAVVTMPAGLPDAGHRIGVSVVSATRRGRYLLVGLRVRNEDGEQPSGLYGYLRQGRVPGRNGISYSASYDASGVHLIDATTVTLPLSYDVSEYDHACLCDADLSTRMLPGASVDLPIWFPAPAAGTRTVTVDVPGRFRITGVPVR